MSIEDSMMKTRTRMQRIGLLLTKYQRKALFGGGLFFMAFAFSPGISLSMGITSYIIGAWGVSAGVLLGVRDRYLILLLGVALALGLGDYYNAPRLATQSGIGIFLGAFTALLHSVNNAGKAKKIRLAPPKPPFMAALMIGILALGVMSPLGSIHLTTAASAKFEITIGDNGEIQCQPGDNGSRYDVLIQDKNNVVQYSLTVSNNSIFIMLNQDGKDLSFEIAKPVCPTVASSIASSTVSPSASEAYFWWDRVWFINETKRTVKYSHPDRESYDIGLWSSWSIYGSKLLHYQFDQTTSIEAAKYGPTVINGLIGAVIGQMVYPPGGAILGFIVGAAVGFLLSLFTQSTWLDESSCLWWWCAKNWLRWLCDYAVELLALWILYPPGAIDATLASFYCMGYLRVGTLTYADFIAVGSPGDPETPCLAAVMWWYDYYITKPGTLYCLYNASQEYEGMPGEYLVSHVGPADVWPDREHAHPSGP